MRLDDGRAVQFPTPPDLEAAPRVRAALPGSHHVEIRIEPDHLVSATVHGTSHHRLRRVPVSIETALALAVLGSPTVVHLPAGGTDHHEEVAS